MTTDSLAVPHTSAQWRARARACVYVKERERRFNSYERSGNRT